MEKRTTTKQVSFRRPFYLRGIPGAQPAGAYTIRVGHELSGPSAIMGWRRTDIVLELISDGLVRDVTMSAQELREALVADGDQGTDPPANGGIRKRPPRERFRPF